MQEFVSWEQNPAADPSIANGLVILATTSKVNVVEWEMDPLDPDTVTA